MFIKNAILPFPKQIFIIDCEYPIRNTNEQTQTNAKFSLKTATHFFYRNRSNSGKSK